MPATAGLLMWNPRAAAACTMRKLPRVLLVSCNCVAGLLEALMHHIKQCSSNTRYLYQTMFNNTDYMITVMITTAVSHKSMSYTTLFMGY